MNHNQIETEDICSQIITSDTDSSERKPTATYNGSLKRTSDQLKNYKNSDFCTSFLNLTKKYLIFVAEGPHTIDGPVPRQCHFCRKGER